MPASPGAPDEYPYPAAVRATTPPTSPSRFDDGASIAMEVVEHLYSPRNLPVFARRVLRPGGHVIVTTPYHGYFKNLAISLANGWDRHHSPLWDGGHIKFWSRRTLTALFVSEGFTLSQSEGAGRVPVLWKSVVAVFRSAARG